MKESNKKIKLCLEDQIMHIVVTVIMALLCVVIVYPLIFVVSSSFSAGSAVSAGKVLLWPVDFSLEGYKFVFSYRTVWTGYANSIFYTVVATSLNLLLNILSAYPLSRRTFHCRKFYTTLYMITMFFGGGLIPTYILFSNLGLTNTRWAIILTGAVSVYNVVVMKTFFQNNIPNELLESAKIDGISDIGYLVRIVLPLSKAIIAVIILYYAVGHWNGYFTAMMYLRDSSMHPLQLILRTILNAGKIDLSEITDAEVLKAMQGLADVLKYSLIIVSAVPMLCAFPFVQKYFEKGIMIGSVKG